MPSANPFQEWIGRERVATDTVQLERARKLAATLDRDPRALSTGDALPRGWHWIYFHEPHRRSELADDGHERRGAFLPPVPLPRRMWAGGRLHFLADVPLGSEVRRTSTIQSVETKEGRSGRLAFVTVQHRLSASDGELLVDEEQDLVYLERSPEPWSPPARPPEPEVEEGGRRLATFVADEVTLFRFSALTFNGHRIHFDRAYATEVEGYPDLVVHGPLLALLLLGAGDGWTGSGRTRREGIGSSAAAGPVRFEYRAHQPAFCGEPLELRGASPAPGSGVHSRGSTGDSPAVELWAEHPTRGLVTRARWWAG